jgi:Down syndrome cell adhesion molecule-like protein 1
MLSSHRLSALIQINVQAPPEFADKLRNQTARRGEPAVLQCEAKGEKPIGILWNMNNIRLESSKSDPRFTIREEILPNGVISSLSIKRTERADTALFTCVATNGKKFAYFENQISISFMTFKFQLLEVMIHQLI